MLLAPQDGQCLFASVKQEAAENGGTAAVKFVTKEAKSDAQVCQYVAHCGRQFSFVEQSEHDRQE